MDLHSDPALLSIATAAKLIETRKLTSLELVKACLDRIEKYDGQVNAFITLTAERALEQAAQADAEIAAGRYRGPLHGIPFGLKDLFDTAGILTTAHSRILQHNMPARDATAVTRLYEAGGVLLGKLATHEFAHTGPSFDLPFPPARNPWNNQHVPGGSSSGSAAAVAAGFVLGALGTDTGGSVRGPSSLCGIAGLKPTYGLVSRDGVIPNSWSLDAVGPLAWTVEDCAILLQAIAGHDGRDPASANVAIPDYRAALRGDGDGDLKGLRIGVARWQGQEDPDDGAALEAAVDVLIHLGASVESVRLRPVQDFRDVKTIIAESELFSNHLHDLRTRPGDFSARLREKLLAAMFFTAADYVEAQRERRRIMEEMEPVYGRFDALITVGPGIAPRFDAEEGLAIQLNTKPLHVFNVLAGPAMAQCIGFSDSGLPRAMQIGSRPFNEPAVLRIAHAYEQATSWRKQRPALAVGKAEPLAMPEKKNPPPPIASGDGTRQLVEVLAGHFGLRLDEAQLAKLCKEAPHALAMARRVHKDRARSEEPANVFRFPAP